MAEEIQIGLSLRNVTTLRMLGLRHGEKHPIFAAGKLEWQRISCRLDSVASLVDSFTACGSSRSMRAMSRRDEPLGAGRASPRAVAKVSPADLIEAAVGDTSRPQRNGVRAASSDDIGAAPLCATHASAKLRERELDHVLTKAGADRRA